jgi:hypothetical protein
MSETAEAAEYKTVKIKRREDLEKKDIVDVISSYGAGDTKMVKRKRATVVKVVRGAAILDIEGEPSTRTVPFHKLEKRVPLPIVEKRRSTGRKKRQKTPTPVPPAPVVVEAEPPPPPAKKSVPPTMASWMANGVKLQEQIIQEAHTIENEIGDLRTKQRKLEDEALQVAGQADARQADLDKLRIQIATLDTMRETIG